MIIKRFRNVYTPLGAVGRVGVKKQMIIIKVVLSDWTQEFIF